MRLIDYLDKGATLGPNRPCLTMGGADRSYTDVQGLTNRIARALAHSGVGPGEKVAILSGNDPVAFACVFGISRAGAVWCPINPRNEATENRFVLDAFDCSCLIFSGAYTTAVEKLVSDLPKLELLVALGDDPPAWAIGFDDWIRSETDDPIVIEPLDDVAMIAGTGGTTGRPKGVMLTGHNLEAMSAITLMSYPFVHRPTYLALAPLTHAAGVLCFPIMALGGRIVILPKPDLADFLAAIERYGVTHTFLPPTLIYMLLEHPALPQTNLASLQCFWYGAAPMSAARLEEAIRTIGPVFGQLFGQTEAPMMISTMAPADHRRDDGSIASERLSSAGRPSPLMQVAVMDDDGRVLSSGSRGEIVVRGPLVMLGYYRDPEATAEAGKFGWHHTGDIGFLDDDNFLYIVDRAKDMIITGGFNVYSVEVEQILSQHPAVLDSAVVGLPDEKWGERVTAVVQLSAGHDASPEAIALFVKDRLGSVKAPKQVEIWEDLPRSKVGKVLKKEIKATLLEMRRAITDRE